MPPLYDRAMHFISDKSEDAASIPGGNHFYKERQSTLPIVSILAKSLTTLYPEN